MREAREDQMEFDQSQEYRPSDAYFQKELEQKKAMLAEEFRQADRNGDGFLNERELLSFLDMKVNTPFNS